MPAAKTTTPPEAAALCGRYTCSTDGCHYRIWWQPVSSLYKEPTLLQARCRPGEGEGEPYSVKAADVRRLLDYHSFIRLDS